MRTLKQFLEVHEPKSPDEKRFKDKHITIKHDDRNGNGDDVFQATNVKKAERKKERHGYEPGEDEKVYEEIEQIDELSYDTLRRYRMKAKSIGDNEKGDINYRAKGRELAGRKTYGGRMTGIEKAKVMASEEADLEEKTLTPAEMKKREEVAKAIERENPNMPMAKKMAIATSTAKKVAEDIAFKAAKKYGTRIEEETDVEEVTAVDVVAEAFETNVVPKMFQPALLAIFEQLSEENQDKFAIQLLTPEGVESLINFAIENRGE